MELIPAQVLALFLRVFGAFVPLPVNGILRSGITKFCGAVGITLLYLEALPQLSQLTLSGSISELIIGIAIACPLVLVGELAKLWAEFFETARGQNTAEIADPGAMLPASQLAVLFRLAIWSYIVCAGALVTLLASLSQSIMLFPPGGTSFALSIEIAAGILKLVAVGIKETACLFLPLGLLFLSIELALGFISKVAPRLNLSHESVSIKSIIGFLFLFCMAQTGIFESIAKLGHASLALLQQE